MNRTTWITLGIIGAIVLVIVLTALLIPENNPAFAAAVTFTNAAATGNDAEAESLMSSELQNYVTENCPDGKASACITGYTPEDWGAFDNAVYRRAEPDGPDAWDILLFALYDDNQGFSGVCIYNRAERTENDTWQIVRWSGFVSCDLPNAGLRQLAEPDAPNHAP